MEKLEALNRLTAAEIEIGRLREETGRLRDLLSRSKWIGYAQDLDGNYARVVFDNMDDARELQGLLVEMRDAT